MGLRVEAAPLSDVAQQYLRSLGNRHSAGSDLDDAWTRSLAHQGVRAGGARGCDRVYVRQAAAFPCDGPAGRRFHSVAPGADLFLYLERMRMGMVRQDIGSQMVDLCGPFPFSSSQGIEKDQ